jgi:hypothetical protein
METQRMKVTRTVLLLAAAALVAPGVAKAEPAKVTRRCVIAYHQCFTVSAGYKGNTPEQRMDRVNERIAAIIARENLTARNIYLVPAGRLTHIYIGRSKLITVTPGDARAERYRSSRALARKWARELRVGFPESRPKGNNWIARRKPRGAVYAKRPGQPAPATQTVAAPAEPQPAAGG